MSSPSHCDRVYVGETGRNIETRIKEHKRDLEKELDERERINQDLLVKYGLQNTVARTRHQRQQLNELENERLSLEMDKTYKTAALQHEMKEGHSFDFENFEILKKEKYWGRRKAMESLFIQLEGPRAVNFKCDTQYINTQTKQILNEHKYQKMRKR